MTFGPHLPWMLSDLSTLSAASVFSIGYAQFPYLVLLSLLALVFIRLLGLSEQPEMPDVWHSSSEFSEEVIRRCSILADRYRPTSLWGKNRHIQVWSFGLLGRPSTPRPPCSLHDGFTEDGARFTICLFEKRPHDAAEEPASDPYSGVPADRQPIIVLCPGIAGSCDASYTQVYIDYMLKHVPHSRVVALNHIGTNKNEELAMPRIFSYGCTLEYSALVDWTRERYPGHPLIAVGFSMGANIIVKYLAEKPERQSWFVGAMSSCQAYSALELSMYYGRGVVPRLYSYVLTFTMCQVVSKYRQKLFADVRIPPAAERSNGRCRNDSGSCSPVCTKSVASCRGKPSCSVPPPDEQQALASWGIASFDEHFSRRVWHFDNLEEFYNAESCGPLLHKITDIPVLFLNAIDDPLVPPQSLKFPLQHARRHKKSLFVTTRHGSHLAFYEGGLVIPNTVSWMDRLSAQYFRAILDMREETR